MMTRDKYKIHYNIILDTSDRLTIECEDVLSFQYEPCLDSAFENVKHKRFHQAIGDNAGWVFVNEKVLALRIISVTRLEK